MYFNNSLVYTSLSLIPNSFLYKIEELMNTVRLVKIDITARQGWKLNHKSARDLNFPKNF